MWSHILRRPCGALQKLEEFNRKASVNRSPVAGRQSCGLPTVNRCVVRVPCGCRVGAVRVPCGCRAGAVRWSTSNCICARRRRSGGTGSLRCCGGISAIFKRLDYDMQCSCPGADPGGGGKGALTPPPPIFWAKNHTHRKK